MNSWKIETKCLQEGYKPGNGEPHILPIYQSTTYRYKSTEQVAKLFDLEESGHMYSRISNPTVECLENKIATLEGGVGALCTSSGQSATLIAILNICKSGDHVVSSSTIYGGTFSTHRQMNDKQLLEAGIEPGLIRFSVGIENVQDIIEDIRQAME